MERFSQMPAGSGAWRVISTHQCLPHFPADNPAFSPPSPGRRGVGGHNCPPWVGESKWRLSPPSKMKEHATGRRPERITPSPKPSRQKGKGSGHSKPPPRDKGLDANGPRGANLKNHEAETAQLPAALGLRSPRGLSPWEEITSRLPS